MSTTTALVHLVDDDAGVLKALARLLATEGLEVSLSQSTREFLARYDPEVPGCIVLDLAMPEMGGLELQALLEGQGVTHPVIFLTGCGDIPSTVRAMKAGALDFLTKPVEVDALLDAVRRGIDLDLEARRVRDERCEVSALIMTLTPREREVLRYVLSGRLNKQIASELGIVEKTIKVHRARVMQKLGVRSVAELVRLAERAKIAPCE
ncbi:MULTISPECIES: response regulator [unclassified Lysobacter]|uniref:response regulator transcription factor n=1 Tax=unclassified Lysobacter TaxID=2635362 RepID=UPI001C2294AD|nr:response regulator [Lysobacter sp. MMG2]MBU8974566.1 response regulator [Lysobacter sp. MMG2]